MDKSPNRYAVPPFQQGQNEVYQQALNAWNGVIDAFEAEYACRSVEARMKGDTISEDHVSSIWLAQSKM